MYVHRVATIDVVVVSYNSRPHLRSCVEPLCRLDGVHVVVVDNASADESVATVADLPVTVIARPDNAGFAVGSNDGWRVGSGTVVLFLNPDASIDEASLRRLAAALEQDGGAGAAVPRIEHPDGSLAYSLRRFPRLRSTFAQALFLHRVFPRAAWPDELVKDEAVYARAGSPEWASGACLLVRRSALVELDGWDEGFFLYGEDVDLCRRLRAAGYELRYEPDSLAVHHEGASASRAAALPLLAAARIRYARKHLPPLAAALERVGVGLWALTHVVVSRGGAADRKGHAQALRLVISGAEPVRPGN